MNDKQQMLASEEGEEFIVERIVSHRFRNGRKEYLLQWKGFSELENTWVIPDFIHHKKIILFFPFAFSNHYL